MELPKNITQIGEADKHCRIYVEDYVVSYIKQMNGMAQNKDIAIALYGRKTAEDGVAYLFAYGSAKLNFLQKPVRHLSQAQEQEIEKLRRKYFSEMTFLGYQILNGEMVEGFQICEQEICRYVSGYAQFYEKNDSMLAYMLENRGGRGRTGEGGSGKIRSGEKAAGGTQAETGERICLPCCRTYGEYIRGIPQSCGNQA